MINDDTPHEPTGVVVDDRLRLVFTCSHPALAPEARVALTLRLLGGLTVAEVAQAFLVPETTMAQRITRAKRKIALARIPYRVPGPGDLAERLDAVLAAVYLVFNEGCLASSGDSPARRDLTGEAVRLGRLLHDLVPASPETTGLLALMLLTEARHDVRVVGGVLVTLQEQDRSGWDRDLVDEGHALVAGDRQRPLHRPRRRRPLAPDVAARCRDLVLAPGGSKDAADLVADFLGRPCTFDSHAAWLAG